MFPELLAPAGDPEKMRFAFAYGADAVYLGVPFFSLRARQNEFQLEQLREGIQYAHALGKKVYVTANVFARNRKVNQFLPQFNDWVDCKPDAFIMSDPGLMMQARENFSDVAIHLSVQANCMNYESVKFWHRSLGVERVILSRELQINEIREIHERVPEVELEAFVHGAICIAYSGRCFLSSYMSYRDANQGVCDNSCREKYVLKEKVLEDLRDPGSAYPIEEDEEGTYIMSAKDLCMIEHLRDLRDAGVVSFKIEGRTKSANYVAQVSRAYRKAIDQIDQPFDASLLEDLNKVANRGFHTGFLNGKPGPEGQNYEAGTSFSSLRRFSGLLRGEVSPEGLHAVEVRGAIEKGKSYELLVPGKPARIVNIEVLLDKNQNSTQKVHPGTGRCWINPLGEKCEYGILSELL